jgi:prepilin-type N-terminal cleavage/methylation domain-containing protein
MLHPTRFSRAFTLVEMLVVMAVIAILAGIILSVNGLVQSKAARTRAEAEIRAMSAGLERYKADNGSYPMSPESSPNTMNGATNKLDPRVNGVPTDPLYKDASLTLYRALSGDMNVDGRVDDKDGKFNIDGTQFNPLPANPQAPTIYLPDFFTPQRLGATLDANGVIQKVTFIKDPYGNSYGYSTKAALVDQQFVAAAATDATAKRVATKQGYNTTYDLWSTAGKVQAPSATGGTGIGTSGDVTNSWVKNW